MSIYGYEGDRPIKDAIEKRRTFPLGRNLSKLFGRDLGSIYGKDDTSIIQQEALVSKPIVLRPKPLALARETVESIRPGYIRRFRRRFLK